MIEDNDKAVEDVLAQEQNVYDKVISDAIREGVDALLQADTFKLRVTDIIEAVHERIGKDKSELRHLITKSYKMQYDTENFVKEKIKTEGTYEFLENHKV